MRSWAMSGKRLPVAEDAAVGGDVSGRGGGAGGGAGGAESRVFV